MTGAIVPREAESAVAELAAGFPVVVITGPRQSGKTTVAREVFGDRPYASLEDPATLDRALEDPRSFLGGYADGCVLDEAQRAPQLLSYLQGVVDADDRVGRWVLTGSQQFGMLSQVMQSLAGRAGLLHLLPFTLREAVAAGFDPSSLDDVLVTGSYPAIHHRGVRPLTWYSNYVATYVERDVRQILNVGDLASFRTFLRLCAGRVGQLVNLSALAAEAGVTHNTARAWLSVLEASYIVTLLHPHHRNYAKRLVKTPKLYLLDTGLAAWLIGVRGASDLATHPLRGALFENWVVAEMHKRAFNAGETPRLWFWRDRSGLEVDVLVEAGRRLKPVEIKSGATVSADQLRGVRAWIELAGRDAVDPTVVTGGDDDHVRTGIRVVGWREVASV